jgi:hypothetical protein
MVTVQGGYIGEEVAATLAPPVIADATTENIQKAKEFINGLTAEAGNVAVCFAGIIVDRTVLLIGHYCSETSLSNY